MKTTTYNFDIRIDKDYNVAYNAGDTYITDGALTLYAVWVCDGTGTTCTDTTTTTIKCGGTLTGPVTNVTLNS